VGGPHRFFEQTKQQRKQSEPRCDKEERLDNSSSEAEQPRENEETGNESDKGEDTCTL
jgi:hypothetical protein